MNERLRALALSALLVTACGREPTQGVTLPLSGTGSSGAVYALQGARFEIVGPSNVTVDGDGTVGDTVSASLPVGDYTVELLSGWTLVRLPDGTPMTATVASPNPQMVTIVTGTRSRVTFAFDVLGEMVTMTGGGGIGVGIEVHETDGGTSDAGPGICAGQAAGTVCRPAADACDVEEVCDGVSPACPADAFAAAGSVCRTAMGECDAQETCDGTTNECPADAYQPAGTPCSGGVCDGMLGCDVDECAAGTAGCDIDATCTNTMDGFRCDCDAGHLGDGFSCTPELDVRTGRYHTCARGGDGSLWCWGLNSSGQLGDGTSTSSTSPVTVLSGVAGVTLGEAHTCAWLDDGSARCWGLNANGQLGDGTTVSSATPVAVAGLAGVTQMVAGVAHTCALLTDGTVQCWGANAAGELGDGTVTSRGTAASVSGLTGAQSLAAGYNHTCAVRTGGDVVCWGYNFHGQLGDGTRTQRETPVTVAITGAEQLEAGVGHTCARLTAGTVSCWGDNQSGQLADPMVGVRRATPGPISGLSDAVELGGGAYHICARRMNGTLRCWGSNLYGQLGDGTGTGAGPVDVMFSEPARAVSRGPASNHSCVQLADGSALCWGLNSAGQLGDGTTTDRPAPGIVGGI